MSKYTKALDKIQFKRDDENTPVEKPSDKQTPDVQEFYEATSKLSPQRPSFDRGIAKVKNTLVDPRIVTSRFPNSLVAEQYRMLRTSLKPSLEKQNAKVIMVSSSIHSEGKTVTTCNLAMALAENGDSKVVVIDADLRRGKLAEYLGFGNKRKGLTNLLSNGLAAKDVMVRNSMENFVLIPRGEIMSNPAELIDSSKLRILISELKNHFDYVIIDSPPIMSVADAGILGRFADGVLMVIQVGRTPKSVIAHSNILFKQAGVKMLGYVLTNVEYQSADYRYYTDYEYVYGYTHDDSRTQKKKKKDLRMKKAGWNFKNMEDKFNNWWSRKILKKEAVNQD